METRPSVENSRLPKLWKYSAWSTTILSCIAATVYLNKQFEIVGRIEDGIFIGILLFNSFVAGAFGAYLYSQSLRLFELLPVGQHNSYPPTQIFGSFQNILFGFGFSTLISASVFLLSPWDNQELNVLLCLFLFIVNFQVGMGAGALTLFWRLTGRSVHLMEIRILNLSRPDIVQFLKMISLTVLLVSFLCSAGVLSLLFSKFDLNLAVVAFSLSSLFLVIISYFAPLTPFILKLKTVKLQELDIIEKRIDQCYKSTIKGKELLEDIEKLLTFRSVIKKIRIIPPNGQFSVLTAFSATFLSFLPTLVQHLLSLLS
jgi:hypothetical protein